MTLNYPLLILSLVLATLYTGLFHLLWGRTFNQLFISWLAALAGLALGQLLASGLGLRDLMIGELHLVTASLSSWLLMALARRVKS